MKGVAYLPVSLLEDVVEFFRGRKQLDKALTGTGFKTGASALRLIGSAGTR
jgi:hypothetical protein